MNWIGWLGIGYVAFWNIVAFVTWKISDKTNKATRWIPLVIAVVTIPPFVMGWFGNAN